VSVFLLSISVSVLAHKIAQSHMRLIKCINWYLVQVYDCIAVMFLLCRICWIIYLYQPPFAYFRGKHLLLS